MIVIIKDGLVGFNLTIPRGTGIEESFELSDLVIQHGLLMPVSAMVGIISDVLDNPKAIKSLQGASAILLTPKGEVREVGTFDQTYINRRMLSTKFYVRCRDLKYEEIIHAAYSYNPNLNIQELVDVCRQAVPTFRDEMTICSLKDLTEKVKAIHSNKFGEK